MTCPMTELMECGPVPIDRLEISRRRRHLHEFAGRVVVGTCTADAEIRTRGCNQHLGAGLNLTWWRRDNRRRNLLGQTIALVGVEDGKTLEKRDGSRLLAGFHGALTFVVRGEAIGIDDGGSPFTLPDMAAQPERLAKGEPALSGEAVLQRSRQPGPGGRRQTAPAGPGSFRDFTLARARAEPLAPKQKTASAPQRSEGQSAVARPVKKAPAGGSA